VCFILPGFNTIRLIDGTTCSNFLSKKNLNHLLIAHLKRDIRSTDLDLQFAKILRERRGAFCTPPPARRGKGAPLSPPIDIITTTVSSAVLALAREPPIRL
jgi:hypothetical protein